MLFLFHYSKNPDFATGYHTGSHWTLTVICETRGARASTGLCVDVSSGVMI